MTVRAVYAWELVRDGAVRERGTIAEGARVAVGPTGVAREGQGPILPWHARLSVAKGRLLAASGDARNPAMLGSLRLPSDFTRIEVPNAVRVGAFELRISVVEAEEPAPDTSRTGEEATVMGRVDETVVGRASAAVAIAEAPVRPTPAPAPATSREPSHAPAPARRPSTEVLLPSNDADRSMMTRLEPIQLVRPRTHAARDAREGVREMRTPTQEAHALAASGSGPVAITRMSEHPPVAAPVRPLTASGSGPIAAAPARTPSQGIPVPLPHPHPHPTAPSNAYAHAHANAYPHAHAHAHANAYANAHAYAYAHANASAAYAVPAPPAAWTAPSPPTPAPTTPPQAWVAEATRTTAPPPAPPAAPSPAPARPRRVIVAVAAGGVAAAAVLFALSAVRPGLVTASRTPAAEPTTSATSPTFRRVGAPPAESAAVAPPKAPPPTAPASPAARGARDADAERRIAKALLAGDSTAATTEANALAAAHPDVAEYRTMRRALRRMTPPSTAD